MDINEQNKRKTWKIMRIALLAGVLLVLASATQSILWQGAFLQNLYFFLYTSGTLLLIAGGSYFTGGLAGFLFGIPKLMSPNPNPTDAEKAKRNIAQNDNLVQISDWVTKIIVGVGLTQLYNLPSFLKTVGVALSYSFGIAMGREWSRNLAIVTILYFAIFGFLSLYIWTRLIFTGMIDGVERDLGTLAKDMETLKIVANDIQEKLVDAGGSKKMDDSQLKDELALSRTAKVAPSSADYLDDPQKGKWGGRPENNGRKISAAVIGSIIPNFYEVTLTVESTDEDKPLTGYVNFHLHNTFRNPNPKMAVYDGKAILKLNMVYGAFTVGAEADEGKTHLELDLAELQGAPMEFRKR